ncbi:MAG: acyltransferase [Caulobacteraceae bacterium]|nr:acyltransferase [Caulobacteraceae bacterium]
MRPDEASNGRGGPLDVMRFLAAAFIVIYHYADDAPTPLGRISPVFTEGWVATDFFLMLSGYVLARAYGERIAAGLMSMGEFVGRRVLKLWPAHAVMLVVLGLMVELARLVGAGEGHSSGYAWAWFPAHLLWAQAWGLGAPPGWNMPTWSLSALVVCYALFPLVWRRLASASRLTAMSAGLFVLFSAAGLAAAAHLRLADLPLQIGVLRAVPLFLFGAAIARLGPVNAAFDSQGARAWLGVAILAGAAVSLAEPSVGVLILVGAAIAVIGSLSPPSPWVWAEKAAAVSFPLFITHFVTGEIYLHGLGRLAGAVLPEWARWPFWAGGFLFALACAVAFQRLVDRPLQTALKRLLDRRRRRPLEPAPAV